MKGKITMVYSPINGIPVGDGHADDVINILIHMVNEAQSDFSIQFSSMIAFDRMVLAIQQGEIEHTRVQFIFPNKLAEKGTGELYDILENGQVVDAATHINTYARPYSWYVDACIKHNEMIFNGERDCYKRRFFVSPTMVDWMQQRIEDRMSWGHGKDYDV